MRATLTPEQVEIERTMREIAERGRAEARACQEHGWRPPDAEGTLLADYSALGLPEEAGGFGTGMVEIVVALEALGRTLVPSHLAGQLAAIQVAAAAGIDVGAAIDGGARWALAADEPGVDGLDDLSTGVAGGTVRGEKTMVAAAGAVDAVVVVGHDGVALVTDAPLTPRAGLDATRPFADLALEAGLAAADEGAGGAHVVASGDRAGGLERALLVAAADLCGAAAGAVELGAAYARDRTQFGKPIGSFQGVAFQLADAFTRVKEAWDLCLYAAWALDVGAAGATLCAHQAKGTAGRAALFAAERTIQVHGGIGITMEADPHLYLRRALATDAWLGSGRWHDRRAGALRVAATRET